MENDFEKVNKNREHGVRILIKRLSDGWGKVFGMTLSGGMMRREYKEPLFLLQTIIFYYDEKVKKMSKIMQKTWFFAETSALFRCLFEGTFRILLPTFFKSPLHYAQVQQGQSALYNQLSPTLRPCNSSPKSEKATAK